MRITATVIVSGRCGTLKGMPLRGPEVLATTLDDLLGNPEERPRPGETQNACARQPKPATIAPQIVKAFDDVILRPTGSAL
jgi:hypothetical protein